MDESTSEGQLFGLASSELTSIKPNYEQMIKNGHLRATEMGIQHVGMCLSLLNCYHLAQMRMLEIQTEVLFFIINLFTDFQHIEISF